MDRFETYYLTEYSDDEFVAIAIKRLEQEGIIGSKDLALYIANSVLRGPGRKTLRDAIRIATTSQPRLLCDLARMLAFVYSKYKTTSAIGDNLLSELTFFQFLSSIPFVVSLAW